VDSTPKNDGPQEISLLESLDGEWIKLPLEVMRDIGPAAQTLGGILKMTSRETFSAAADIALKARLPLATVRKHLATLGTTGWINNKGRGHTPSGKPRRTATISITKKTLDAIDGEANPDKLLYGFLPWWACCSVHKVGKLQWSAKAVLAVIMSRTMALKAAAQRDNEDITEEDELICQFANMGGDDRFRISLRSLTTQTGLTHDSVTRAKRVLHRLGILDWQGTPRTKGRFKSGTTPDTDLLMPDWNFRVIATPASKGKVFIRFGRYAKSGQ